MDGEIVAGDPMIEHWRHYERAFEEYLRVRGVAYVGVDEARRALAAGDAQREAAVTVGVGEGLKYFDFVVYAPTGNLLVELKGRRIVARGAARGATRGAPGNRPTLQNWTTREDLASLKAWRTLFGPGFDPIVVFAYWCDDLPPAALYEEVFEHGGRWYALRSIGLNDYAAAMRVRSERWGTVHLSTADFDRLSRPFLPGAARVGGQCAAP